MKTKILSVITILVVVLGFTKPTLAATANHDAYTVLNDINNINKIEVHGNVELFVSDANTDQVKVYNKYYSESALVQSKNGVLSIASYSTEKLVVWVSAADLRAISAYDNAEIRTFGKLSKIEFDVDLHDSALANLNLNAFDANLTVKDNAKANLTGTADQLTLNSDIENGVNRKNFTAARYSENKSIFSAELSSETIGM